MAKKTDEELLEILKKKMKTKAPENDKAIGNYGGISAKGDFDGSGLGSGCHASLRYFRRGIVFLSNWPQQMKAKSKDHKVLEFADFLVNRSNFAPAFVNKSVDDVLKNGFIVDCRLPRDFVAAASVATRVCHEKPNKSDIWFELSSRGINESLAFLMSSLISSIETVEEHLSYTLSYETNHFSYTVSPGPSKDYCQNVIKGKYYAPKATFYDEPGYSGFSHIWSDKSDYKDGWLVDMIKKHTDEVRLGGRDPKMLNPWGSHPPERKIKSLNFETFNEEVKRELS